MRRLTLCLMGVAAAGWLLGASPAGAFGLTDVLTAPATLIERAVEARSTSDIAKDNAVVLKVNGLMADYKVVSVATEIYEQRLLMTGIFDNKKDYEGFKADVKKVEGIKKLYWHVIYMSEADQKKNDAKLIDWDDALVMTKTIGAKLLGTSDIHSVNFRVTTDSYGTVYLLGRAFSKEELNRAMKATKETDGVKKIVSYVEIRP